MFQRKPERKQLHGVDANSAFFTSHARTVATPPKSPIEVGFADPSMIGIPKARPIRRRTSSSASAAGGAGAFGIFLLIWTVVVLACGYAYMETVKIPAIQGEVRRVEVATAAEVWTEQVSDLQTNVKKLQRDNAQLKKEQSQTDTVRMKELQENVDKLQTKLDQEREEHAQNLLAEQEKNSVSQVGSVLEMQKGIQELSKRALIEKFGPGPHKVEFEVNFPKEPLEQNWYFVVELAKVDDMPHTVYTFLQQISNHLYDDGGYSFFANAGHVVQGGPVSNHLTPKGISPAGNFKESGYETVLFPEYSTHMRHKKYTLGMSGRPGGPKFYINMIDNSKNHGPGGYATDGTGDPCFGKIIRGLDVVEKLHAASGPLDNGNWKDTEGGPVAVRSVKILK
mmetsp:Transcript_714/g.991  ORF Transcript_714/g.991 Transcript_714/m.991 type:complete len:395 (+) Transcript_714:289-1473(+)|eukprot:CAMPEP_0117023348 /NCGR_PEP_ID=MMETSP0472-20121206/17436_1 /TAXON_ID=693140 ORGANISM="Tiarina fusus, Strain LIS" /NCGR_SAMPLE_ID=MMETSP0472 /ASSEMBLY_ACC=CAM_ASM_000603 /LENGTH=394 /DNA_ID=CAMNT_0004729443 /DNA_START=288 /DNA_END=1472 /DNA_ORIENTATION=-